jgi:allophanate hydrolase
VPAALNNIVGWKPTRGAWSTSGLVPACRTLDCVSVFALTVADAQRLSTLVEGFDPSDPYSRVRPTSITHAPQPRKLRLAIPDNVEFFGDNAAKAAFEATLATLEGADVVVEPIRFEPFKELARLLYEGPWVAERLTVVEPLLLAAPNSIDPVVRGIVQQGRDYSAVQTFRVEYRRAALARAIAIALAPFDALVVPTTPTVFTINEVLNDPVRTNARLGTYTNFTNLADLCALAVPGVFRHDGLPAGVTLLAPAWHEADLVTVGTLMEGLLTLPRGATKVARDATLPETPAKTVSKTEVPDFEIAVVGAHLSGMALNPQLQGLGATLVKKTSTSASYRLYVLPNTTPVKPGMVRDASGSKINLEVWKLRAESFAQFVSAIPAPLGIGNIELDDGHWVKGFICEPYALHQAVEITQFGGFREYLATRG